MDWLEPVITSAGVLLSAGIVAWWQFGGEVAARRRGLAQEIEMLQKMPLETPEGQEYAAHVRNSISRYVTLAEYPRWQRLLYRGWLYVVPWLIYKVYSNRDALTGRVAAWVNEWLDDALLGLAVLGGILIVARFVRNAVEDGILETAVAMKCKHYLRRAGSRIAGWWRTSRLRATLKRRGEQYANWADGLPGSPKRKPAQGEEEPKEPAKRA